MVAELVDSPLAGRAVRNSPTAQNLAPTSTTIRRAFFMLYKSEAIAKELLLTDPFRKTDFSYGGGQYLDFVFLCGKKTEDGDNRSQITERLLKTNDFQYPLYSEKTFKLFEAANLDLLKTEEVLADISSRILIIVESFGSACELGAFSLVDSSVPKLLIIQNRLFKDDGSFVEDGPLKKIKAKGGEDRVLYETFSDDGALVFSPQLVEAIKSLRRSSFIRRPFSQDTVSFLIKDLGCLVCMLFEYVLRFGFLRRERVREVVDLLVQNKNKANVVIHLSSGNQLTPEESGGVIDALPEVLVSLGLLETSKNKGEEYYRIGSELIGNAHEDLGKLTSLIFYGRTFDTRVLRKKLSQIRNRACQEGFQLWKRV